MRSLGGRFVTVVAGYWESGRAGRFSCPTIAERAVTTRGRSTGFDFLRIALALAVVCWHAIVTSYGKPTQDAVLLSNFRSLPAVVLPMFFALSGYLVAGSLERAASLTEFLVLRALRILPALVAEVVLSALVLGAVVTELSLTDYFRSGIFHEYFLNIVGYIHYRLPGVFLHNPLPEVVNGQLWTIPFELECYILLAILACIRGVPFRAIIIGAVIIAQLAFAMRAFFGSPVVETTIPGRVLVFTFLCGVAIHYFRKSIPWDPAWAFTCAFITLILLYTPRGSYFVAMPMAYVTVFLGLLNPPKPGILATGDYSYGVFLYGFPIQQFVAWLGPWTHDWYVNLALSVPAALAFSILSWHCLEKRALALRRLLGSRKPSESPRGQAAPGPDRATTD